MPASNAFLARETSASLRAPSIDWPLLKRVSRSFYLSLRLLPRQVRESIALAYLLARLSDTLVDGATTDGERQLLARRQEIEAWLSRSPDRLEIESVWSTIRQGQGFDQERFSANSAPLSPEELDRYTYLVAGCVGEFWTLLCQKKMPGFAALEFSELRNLGIRFGKGLQLVNILRDRHGDALMGRIYVPPERLLPSWRKLARILMLPGDTSMRCRSIVCAWPVLSPSILQTELLPWLSVIRQESA